MANRIRPLSPATIETRIHLIRGQRVMLDRDLAAMYGVQTKVLNQAVRRNAARFPLDFAFTLTPAEAEILRSQSVTSKAPGGRRYAPRAFTEQGVAMLSSVLHSSRAIHVNIAIVRAFVRLREMLISHQDLPRRIDDLERKYDGNFSAVFDALRDLTSVRADDRRRKRIGFVASGDTHAARGRLPMRRLAQRESAHR